MLNELIQAAKALPPLPSPLHKELKALPKSPAFKIQLASDGTISSVIPWSDDISVLRKWQPGGLGFSFPTFNVGPLFKPALSDKTLETLQTVGTAADWPSLFQTIENACDELACTWLAEKKDQVCAVNERYRKSLEEVPKQLLETMAFCGEHHLVLSALVTRLQRLLAERFFLSLSEYLEQQLKRSFDARLFKLFCATSQAEADKSFNILLDIPDWDDMDLDAYPVTSRETTTFLNKLLALRDRSGDGGETTNCIDAYGQTAVRADDKFDDVNTALGKIILRAMTKDAPCQYRYGKADADSYVVGEISRRHAKGALEFLTKEDARGKTWQFRGGNLVLIYPENSLPDLFELNTADFCSLPDQDGDEPNQEATFLARAERIAKAFDGRPLDSEVPVHLIVLRKPDGHRTKVVAHQYFTMAHLINSAKRWVVGAGGCPPISFARWGAEKGTRADIVPQAPFPGEVVNWLNTYWVRNGESQGKVSMFRLEDALILLLAANGTEVPLAAHAIRQAIKNWGGFLAMHGQHQRSAVVLKFVDKRTAALRSLPAILSLLLHKLGHTKEQTMNSPAFLVGRLLALADALHFQYCLGVRNGSTPPQLLGNALMQTALETPQAALALYGQRILPYQAWAKTCTAPQGFSPERLAKSLLGQLAETSAEVTLTDIPERACDADKAQMILGYLAKTKSDE